MNNFNDRVNPFERLCVYYFVNDHLQNATLAAAKWINWIILNEHHEYEHLVF